MERSSEGGPAAGAGRHLVAGAGHRHRRGGPGRCSSSRPRRWPRACSASAAPATWSARPARGASSPPTARTSWRPRRSPAACCAARSSRRTPRAIRWTCWRSRSWRWSPSRPGTRTRCSTWCAAPTPISDLTAARLPGRAGDAGRPLPEPGPPRAARPPGLGSRSTTGWRRCPARACWPLTNGGTIPDRGAFGAYLGDGKTKLGELDEEFVFETRVGDTFMLGSQVWRVHRDDRRPGHGGRGAGRVAAHALLARRLSPGGPTSWASGWARSGARWPSGWSQLRTAI